jgi:alkanesulfonate monooxygenase SsuD/methylene tetrahydromethanopterin reductase-like flavin-dependent oxidoreductase (luciferase family)
MKYGFVLPAGDARVAAEIAHEAERAGWDGFFVYETVWGIDAWVSLTAAAMRTEHIRLGTDLTPLSRMRPWKLASETVTLDQLSGGRVILAVGLGAIDTGFEAFGEVIDRRERAELLDEGLDILNGLWAGQPFSYEGKHYQIKPTSFPPPPPPVQQPRIPIWTVGAWPREKSMQRVLRCDGIMPAVMGDDGAFRETTPDDIRAIREYVAANRTLTTAFDIVMEGETPGDDPSAAAEVVGRWADAGATWWIESRWELPRDADGLKIVRERILQGPPRPNAK